MTSSAQKGRNSLRRLIIAVIFAPLPFPLLLGLFTLNPHLLGLYLISGIVFGYPALLLFGLPWHFLMKALGQKGVLPYAVGGLIGGCLTWALTHGVDLTGAYGLAEVLKKLLADSAYSIGFVLCAGAGVVTAVTFWAGRYFDRSPQGGPEGGPNTLHPADSVEGPDSND